MSSSMKSFRLCAKVIYWFEHWACLFVCKSHYFMGTASSRRIPIPTLSVPLVVAPLHQPLGNPDGLRDWRIPAERGVGSPAIPTAYKPDGFQPRWDLSLKATFRICRYGNWYGILSSIIAPPTWIQNPATDVTVSSDFCSNRYYLRAYISEVATSHAQ